MGSDRYLPDGSVSHVTRGRHRKNFKMGTFLGLWVFMLDVTRGVRGGEGEA